MRKLRVLVVTDRYPPHIAGGYEVACHAVAERLRRRGHEVLVLTSEYGVGRSVRDGHIHRTLHCSSDATSLLDMVRLEARDNECVTRTAREWRPDVIYAWCLLQLFCSLHVSLRRLGVPIVHNIQDLWLPTQLRHCESMRGTWPAPGSSVIKRLVKPAVRALIRWRRADLLNPIRIEDLDLSHVIFCSRFRQRQHVESGLPLGDSTVIYNGIDLARFERCNPASHNGRLRVVFCGRLVPEKGAHTAIEALAQIVKGGCRRVSLTIVGRPAHPWDYAERLRRLVAENGLEDHVRFVGAVPNAEIVDVYQQHDVLVFPSICYEGFPVTLLEAMACGLAVVGTTTGGSAEILEDGVTGLAFSPENAEELAHRLMHLADEPNAARSLGQAARELVFSSFGIDTICRQTEEHLRRIADCGLGRGCGLGQDCGIRIADKHAD